ncbi:Holliday junction resolvase RuvX [Candidatus Uhrbacteria bacterium]|nr:Holliday junction resolvase RuvX [Candidatus Uhrbacteria bacterium]
MRYLGIDYGLKKIGIAVGDDASGLAFPFGVIPAGEDAPVRIVALAEQEQADAFVVGIPIPNELFHSDEQLRITMAFVRALQEATDKPVSVVDEQFSSAEARRMQKEYGVKAAEDAVAAQIVLQAHLDELRRN